MRYTKKDIDSPKTIYACKTIQIWRFRVVWYTFIENIMPGTEIVSGVPSEGVD